MAKIKSHYDNLQVQETASIDVIKGAYKHLIQKWHPDKHPKDRAKAERITKLLNDAFYVLSDPVKRKAHDEWIAEQRNQGKQKHGDTESVDNSSEKNNHQTDKQKSEDEHVSNNTNTSPIKPANKQYFALFFSTAAGVAFVYTLLYGLGAAAAYVQLSKNSLDLLLIGFGITIGIAILPLFVMKFWNNKAGWISALFCVFFYYHGVKNDIHKNNSLVDSKDNAPRTLNDSGVDIVSAEADAALAAEDAAEAREAAIAEAVEAAAAAAAAAAADVVAVTDDAVIAEPTLPEPVPLCREGDGRTEIPVWQPTINKDGYLSSDPPQKDGLIVYIQFYLDSVKTKCDNNELNSFSRTPEEDINLSVNIRGNAQFANGYCYFAGYYMNERVMGMHQGWIETYFGAIDKKEVILSNKYCLSKTID